MVIRTHQSTEFPSQDVFQLPRDHFRKNNQIKQRRKKISAHTRTPVFVFGDCILVIVHHIFTINYFF